MGIHACNVCSVTLIYYIRQWICLSGIKGLQVPLARYPVTISTRGTQADALYPKRSIYELLFEPSNDDDENAVILVNVEKPDRFYTFASLRQRILKLGGVLQQKYQWQLGDILAVCAENTACVYAYRLICSNVRLYIYVG